jgi:SAM-dependent methyltransferase
MPSVDDNKKQWDGKYDWSGHGDEWSASWGSPSIQWYGTILPRIHHFLPTDTILEIACGYGRWTQFLKNMCHNLKIIDLSEECIQACKKRFSESSNISYHLNDGKSLQMISDASVDLVFSFDSLVHADNTVMEAYISQLPRILKDEGIAFIHHSNLGEYRRTYSGIVKNPKLGWLLGRLGILERRLHGRDINVSATTVKNLAAEHGLSCISQEVLSWGTKRTLIDCFSTIVKNRSTLARKNQFYRNDKFMQEVRNLHKLSRLYSFGNK